MILTALSFLETPEALLYKLLLPDQIWLLPTHSSPRFTPCGPRHTLHAHPASRSAQTRTPKGSKLKGAQQTENQGPRGSTVSGLASMMAWRRGGKGHLDLRYGVGCLGFSGWVLC